MIIHRNYPIPIAETKEVKEEIKSMIKLGIIESSTSPYCNPIRVVDKCSIRICMDRRFINKILDHEHKRPPNIKYILQKHEKMRIFSMTDFTQGYYQVPLEEKSRKCTAFVFEGICYNFCKILFALQMAGSGFVRALNKASQSEMKEFASTYIGDVLITSDTFSPHL